MNFMDNLSLFRNILFDIDNDSNRIYSLQQMALNEINRCNEYVKVINDVFDRFISVPDSQLYILYVIDGIIKNDFGKHYIQLLQNTLESKVLTVFKNGNAQLKQQVIFLVSTWQGTFPDEIVNNLQKVFNPQQTVQMQTQQMYINEVQQQQPLKREPQEIEQNLMPPMKFKYSYTETDDLPPISNQNQNGPNVNEINYQLNGMNNLNNNQLNNMNNNQMNAQINNQINTQMNAVNNPTMNNNYNQNQMNNINNMNQQPASHLVDTMRLLNGEENPYSSVSPNHIQPMQNNMNNQMYQNQQAMNTMNQMQNIYQQPNQRDIPQMNPYYQSMNPQINNNTNMNYQSYNQTQMNTQMNVPQQQMQQVQQPIPQQMNQMDTMNNLNNLPTNQINSINSNNSINQLPIQQTEIPQEQMNKTESNNQTNQIQIKTEDNEIPIKTEKKKRKKTKKITRDYMSNQICPECHLHVANLQQHKEWHLKKQDLTRGISRNWYVSSDKWVVTEVGTHSTIEKYIKEEEVKEEKRKMIEENEFENDNEEDIKEENEVVLRENEEPRCMHCEEQFDMTSDMKLKQCVRARDGKLVHKDCLEDYVKNLN